MLYALDLYNDICQLYLNKAGKKAVAISCEWPLYNLKT